MQLTDSRNSVISPDYRGLITAVRENSVLRIGNKLPGCKPKPFRRAGLINRGDCMLRRISPSAWSALNNSLKDPIEYRKSGLSLNHVVGCPLDCSYCVRHLFNNFEMKEPTLLMSDAEAVSRL